MPLQEKKKGIIGTRINLLPKINIQTIGNKGEEPCKCT